LERFQLIPVAFAILTFLSTAAGGLFALHRRRHLYLVMGAAAGLLVGSALLDLLPEAIELSGPRPLGTAIAAAGGFSAFYVADHFVHLGASEHRHEERERAFGSMAALGLTLHSLLDGLAIGSAFHADTKLGVVVGIAVVAHDFGDGVSTVGVVLGAKSALRASIGWLIADAVAPVAGALLAPSLILSRAVLAGVLASFAGSFLFLGAAHLLPEAGRAGQRGRLAVVFLAGLAFTGAATWLAKR
jgi:ZIP family zinc transporter